MTGIDGARRERRESTRTLSPRESRRVGSLR
jgi:hypothetical protein